MHFTLTKQTNLRLIVIWAGFAALLLLITQGRAALCCGLGAALGITAGLLQSKTLRERAREFAQTKTAFDVRRVLTSTAAGALSVRRSTTGAPARTLPCGCAASCGGLGG